MISLGRRSGKDLRVVDRWRVLLKENVALLARSKKKSTKDLSKVKCFACNQYGHLASECPEKKKKKDEDLTIAATTEIDDFAEKFEKDFSLFSLVSSADNNGFVMNGSWFIDSGSSCHMTGMYHIFRNIIETNPDRMVESEGGTTCSVRGFGRVRFQVQQGELLDQDGVLFVLGLSVNLLFCVSLGGCRVFNIVSKGHVYIFQERAVMRNVFIYSEGA